jgi:hypothetical protein
MPILISGTKCLAEKTTTKLNSFYPDLLARPWATARVLLSVVCRVLRTTAEVLPWHPQVDCGIK